jgi:hypothetical protein
VDQAPSRGNCTRHAKARTSRHDRHGDAAVRLRVTSRGHRRIRNPSTPVGPSPERGIIGPLRRASRTGEKAPAPRVRSAPAVMHQIASKRDDAVSADSPRQAPPDTAELQGSLRDPSSGQAHAGTRGHDRPTAASPLRLVRPVLASVVPLQSGWSGLCLQ